MLLLVLEGTLLFDGVVISVLFDVVSLVSFLLDIVTLSLDVDELVFTSFFVFVSFLDSLVFFSF